jgi:hypothetical protein
VVVFVAGVTGVAGVAGVVGVAGVTGVVGVWLSVFNGQVPAHNSFRKFILVCALPSMQGVVPLHLTSIHFCLSTLQLSPASVNALYGFLVLHLGSFDKSTLPFSVSVN